MTKISLLIIAVLAILMPVQSQDFSNSWKDHFSFASCKYLAETDNYVIGANEVAVVIYNKNTQVTKKMTRVNGLSDVDITAIGALSNDAFIVGYSNGNIDYIKDQKVTNLPELLAKDITGSKQINHFNEYNNLIYCSLNFAILVIDAKKLEVADTYYPGDNGDFVQVNKTIVYNDRLYAATSTGLKSAAINDPQIAFYKSWALETSLSGPAYGLTVFDSKLFVTYGNSLANITISYSDNAVWKELGKTTTYKDISSTRNSLILTESGEIRSFNKSLIVVSSITTYNLETIGLQGISPNISMLNKDETALFVADNNFGIVKKSDPFDVSILPNGPKSNLCFSLQANDQGIYSLAGSTDESFNNSDIHYQYSYFNFRDWQTGVPNANWKQWAWRDLIQTCVDKTDPSQVYIASWGGGAFKVNGTSMLENYDRTNSKLVDINNDFGYIRVGGIGSDSKGNIWMTNGYVANGLVMKSKDSNWYSYSYGVLKNLHSTRQLLITRDDNIWIPFTQMNTTRNGFVVINTNKTPFDETDDSYRGPQQMSKEDYNDPRNAGQLLLWNEEGEEHSGKIYALAEDKNGYVWVGTEKGVLVYYKPWAIFSEEKPLATRPKVARNDGSNLADYLLENESITCIFVDGANRKWIGTKNSGAYLVSEDGLKTYQTFNKSNSPLPSNEITSIAVSPTTGEVFIGTTMGLVSFKGNATEGEAPADKIYAYPNPVRENFNGLITVLGMP